MSWLWFVTVVIGPILLLAAIVYATLRYRGRDKRMDAYSDRKAHELREELSREDS